MTDLVPVVFGDAKHTRITFAYDINEKDDDDFYLNNETALHSFIERALARYYNRYSSQPRLSRALRIVDVDKLVGDILLTIWNSDNKGGCRVYVHCFVANHSGEEYFVPEYIQYAIHWYQTEPDQLLTVFPNGYQLWHDVSGDPENRTIKSTVSFDMCVLHNDISDSLDFFTETAIPGLVPYLGYLVAVYEDMTRGQFKCQVDTIRIQEKIAELITTLYDRRLHIPGNRERHIVFLEAIYHGDGENRPLLTFNVLLDTFETTTPHLDAGHPDYKATKKTEHELVAQYGAKVSMNVQPKASTPDSGPT